MRNNIVALSKRVLFNESYMIREWKKTAAEVVNRHFGASRYTRSAIERIARVTLPWDELARNVALTAMVNGGASLFQDPNARQRVGEFVTEMRQNLCYLSTLQDPTTDIVALLNKIRTGDRWTPVALSLNPKMDRDLCISHGLLDLPVVETTPESLRQACLDLDCVLPNTPTHGASLRGGLIAGNMELEYCVAYDCGFPFALVGKPEVDRMHTNGCVDKTLHSVDDIMTLLELRASEWS